MICEKCGKEIPEGMSNCTCDSSVEEIKETENAEIATETAENVKKPLNKKLLAIILAAVGGIAVLAVAAIVLFSLLFNKLDLTQFVKLKGAVGFDGYANAQYTVDFSGIAEELKFEEIRDIKKFEKAIKNGECAMPTTSDEVEEIAERLDLDLDEIEDLFDAVTFKVENNGKIKNKDTVTLSIEVDQDIDDFIKKLKGGTLTATAKGLKKAEQIDLFADTTVNFEGEDKQGTVSITGENYDYPIAYEFSKSEGLSNGEEVVITATVEEARYEELQKNAMSQGKYLPKTATKTVTVEGLKVYITSQDQITNEMIDQLVALARADRKFEEEYNKLELDKTFIYFVKMTADSYSNKNAIAVTVKYKGGYGVTTAYENCEVPAQDGSFSYTDKEPVLQGRDHTREDIENAIKSEYWSSYEEVIKVK